MVGDCGAAPEGGKWVGKSSLASEFDPGSAPSTCVWWRYVTGQETQKQSVKKCKSELLSLSYSLANFNRTLLP